METLASTERAQRLAAQLREDGVDAYLASSPISMRYLHGFGEDGHERFLMMAIRDTGEVRLICPALTETKARRGGVADIRAWKDGEDPLRHFGELAEDWTLRSSIIAVDDEMRAGILLAMQGALPAALFKPGHPILAKLMRVKDEAELELLARAARIADEALDAGLAAIRPGATELDVQRALNREMERLGGVPTFCLVGAGANGAEPHHETDATPIRDGDVVVLDYGCEVDGYQSDITRTVALGDPGEEAHRVYHVVYQAHLAGRRAIQPGVSGRDVDRDARKVIVEAGYGEWFVHRTGHGIGMRGHEEPYVAETNTEPLDVGNCVSVEPGVYLPGRFGVRIENIVTVEEGGERSLNDEPLAELLCLKPA